MFSRRSFLKVSLAAPLVAVTATSAFAAEPPIYSGGGFAINGYDPVAYFTQSEPVKGDDAFTTEWMGAMWKFASAENMAMFEANPEGYAPQYGGYCSYAVSRGYTASTSPNAWTIYEGKLYLNFNRVVRGLWSRDIPGNIVAADANWPDVLG